MLECKEEHNIKIQNFYIIFIYIRCYKMVFTSKTRSYQYISSKHRGQTLGCVSPPPLLTSIRFGSLKTSSHEIAWSGEITPCHSILALYEVETLPLCNIMLNCNDNKNRVSYEASSRKPTQPSNGHPHSHQVFRSNRILFHQYSPVTLSWSLNHIVYKALKELCIMNMDMDQKILSKNIS